MSKKKQKDQARLLHSTSSFYSDLCDENTIYAVLVRSPVSSGTIRSIKCKKLPPNYALFTADDLVHEKNISILENTIPIFAKDRVSYKGEPIGILTGADYSVLCSLLQSVEITFTEVFSDKAEENIFVKSVSYGSSKKTKETKTLEIETSYTLQLDIEETQETNGALCYASGKTLSVYAPTQWFSNLEKNLISATGYSSEHIRIHKTKLPLSEKNVPWNTTLLAVQCALASIWTNKAVLLSLSRDEQNLFDDFRHSVTISHCSKVTKEGRIISCDVTIDIDSGAYNPFEHIILNRLIIASIGGYEFKKFSIDASSKNTNNPPASSINRWLDYNGFFAIENHIQRISTILDLNPVEVRLININTNEKKFPFNFDRTLYSQTLDAVTTKSDFFRKYATYSLNPYTKKSKKSHLPHRGIGISTAYEGNGYLGAISESALQKIEVSMEMNGKVVIKVLAHSETISDIWKEIASTILSVHKEDIYIDSDFLHNEQVSLPESMLGNIFITSQLLRKACLALQKQRFYHALPLKVSRTFNLSSKKTWDNTKLIGKPFYANSWVAIVCEIELEITTYTYRIRSIWVSLEAGKVMDKRKARYSIESCIKQILSPFFNDLTQIEPILSVSFVENGEEPKQIRELVYNALPAAITNALSQALQTNIKHFPIRQTEIYESIEKLHSDTMSTLSEQDGLKIQEENSDARKS